MICNLCEILQIVLDMFFLMWLQWTTVKAYLLLLVWYSGSQLE